MGNERQRKWQIISLTDHGQTIAKSIFEKFPSDVSRIHKPLPFTTTVQELFMQGIGLIFVCATGIVMRSLAPVLTNKYQDPPVLVLDEQGRFVIPLLSGHEGLANCWASRVAGLINAECIITTANYYTPMAYVAGMGCIRGCSIDMLRQLLFDNLQRLHLDPEKLIAISSISVKENEIALIAIAKELSVPFVVYDAKKLRQMESRLTSKSDYVFSEVGCYGVSESAALLHADNLSSKPSMLLIPKVKNAEATLSIAEIIGD